MEKTFSQWKKQCLQKVDLSKKGSVDRDIEPVVSLLNSCEDFFTTSSCSGRIIVFDGAAGEIQKQKCTWLFVSHHRCSSDDLMSSLSRSTGDAVLKFEPAVLHVQCRRLEDAQLVHSVAVNSGFRNSGLTVGRTGKIISAVRSTHGLEVPLTHNATLLVDPQYIQFLSQIANQKMEENLRRIHRFYQNIQSSLSAERRHIPECPASQDAGHPQQTQEDKGGEEEEENKSNVYTRRRRRQKHDGYNEDRDSSPTQLDDCLHLFT